MGIELKGARVPFTTRLVRNKDPDRLTWMMEQGLAWRGSKPEGWRPRPKSFRAWIYLIFVMLPRAI
jgi:hypothetical protein